MTHPAPRRRNLPPDEPTRQAKARRPRVISMTGGLLLAASFFMPAVQSCNTPIVPAREVWDVLHQPSLDLAELAGVFALYLAAYLSGAVFFLETLLRLLRRRTFIHARAWLCAGVIFLDAVIVVVLLMWLFAEQSPPPGEIGIFGLFWALGCITLVYVIRAVFWLKHRAHLCVGFIGALIASVWFVFVAIDGLYGARVSLAGSVLILLGTIWEAKILTRRSLPGTLWRLVSCRLYDLDLPPGSCPGCDYNLFGLSEKRCPECGRAFTFEELGMSPDELGYAGRVL